MERDEFDEQLNQLEGGAFSLVRKAYLTLLWAFISTLVITKVVLPELNNNIQEVRQNATVTRATDY